MTDMLPKLRPLNVQWVDWEGRPMVSLQDPLRLGGGGILVPEAMAQLLALSDGTRTLEELRRGFTLRTGIDLMPAQVESLFKALDEACMLDNSRFRQAMAEAMGAYRSGPFRVPALAGGGYPAEPQALKETMDHYCREAGSQGGVATEGLTGLICPHIDYPRGWRTYAETWQKVQANVEDAELIIVLGTDHSGSPGSLTLTRQNYATPWGAMPTDTAVVDDLASILGEEQAFEEEAHHIGEHSIELAAVWLHYVAGGKAKTLLPILCGGPEPFLEEPKPFQEEKEPGNANVRKAVDLLTQLAGSRRTIVVAAADISHVGPVFGDRQPLDAPSKNSIRASDELWLEAACSGDSGRLRDHMAARGDPTRICGATPIYLTAAILGSVRGRLVHYDQCPADEDFGSLVSIAGVLYCL